MILYKYNKVVTLVMACLSAVAALTSCGDTTDLYSRSACYLVIDNSMHQNFELASAMQYPGAFVTITTPGKKFHFVSNQGGSSDAFFNAIDERRSFILGYNGALIVGYGLSIDRTFYAYDRECPNCYDPDALPRRSHPVKVDEQGIATCSNCHRSYDLNNGGIVSQGDGGKQMTRYPASTTGPYGILVVQ